MGVNAIPVRSKLYENDSKWAWKFVLRVLAIIVALVGIGCVAWAVAQINSTGYFDSYAFLGWAPFDLIPLGLSLLWNITNIAVLLARKRAIHPGANVGCDLILWLALIALGVFLTFEAVMTIDVAQWNGDNNSSQSTTYGYYANGTTTTYTYDKPACNGYNDYSCAATDNTIRQQKRRGAVEVVGTTMTFLLFLFHFALFISACRYTHQRRRDEIIKQAKLAVREARESESQNPIPPVPQIRENGHAIQETSKAAPVGSTEDYPLPLSVPRTEGVNHTAPKVTSNSWAQNGSEV